MIRSLNDAFGRGDIPTILNALADNVDWYDPGPPAVTHAGRYRGRDDVLRFFSRTGESLEIEAFEPTEFIAKGDRVTPLEVVKRLRGDVSGMVGGDRKGLRPGSLIPPPLSS